MSTRRLSVCRQLMAECSRCLLVHGRLDGGDARRTLHEVDQEPLSNLDAKLRVQTRAEIARLHQRLQATMIYVTHDQIEAMTMGDRIAVLNEGVLQQAGTPKELYETPRNRFVAGFIGSPAMNFVEVRVSRDTGTPRLSADELEVRLDETRAALLRNHRGDSVVLGFRLEHLELGGSEGPGLRLKARVDVVKFLGNEELVHARWGERDIVALVKSRNGLAVDNEIVLSAAPRPSTCSTPKRGWR